MNTNEEQDVFEEDVDIDIDMLDGEDIPEETGGENIPEESEGDIDIENVDDFEFDTEGNIILPTDESSDEETEEVTEEDESEDAPTDDEEVPAEENRDTSAGDATSKAAKSTEEKADKSDGRDAEIARLKAELAQRDNLTKDALGQLGVDSGDEPQKQLLRLAAESAGMSEEEYLLRQKKEAMAQEAEAFYKKAKYNKLKSEDLAEIHKAFPDSTEYSDVEQFPNFEAFGRLRDAGASPKEAYLATHSDKVLGSVASAARQSAKNNKGHLNSRVPKGVSGGAITMSRAKLAEWREVFTDKSDKEIMRLYRETAY